MRIRCVAGLTMALVVCPGVAARASTTSVFYDGSNNLAADPQPFLCGWGRGPRTRPWDRG